MNQSISKVGIELLGQLKINKLTKLRVIAILAHDRSARLLGLPKMHKLKLLQNVTLDLTNISKILFNL